MGITAFGLVAMLGALIFVSASATPHRSAGLAPSDLAPSDLAPSDLAPSDLAPSDLVTPESRSTHNVRPAISDARSLLAFTVYRASDGRATALAGLGLGRRPVLLNLWATWCEPCLTELPELERLHQEYGPVVRFLGISQDLNSPDNRRAVREVVARAGVHFDQLLEPDGVPLEQRVFGKGVTALPAFVLFDKEGKLRLSLLGSLANAHNRRRLQEELRRLSPPSKDAGGGKVP